MIIEKGNIWLFQLMYRILRGSLTKVINVFEALKMGSVLYGAEQNRSRGLRAIYSDSYKYHNYDIF